MHDHRGVGDADDRAHVWMDRERERGPHANGLDGVITGAQSKEPFVGPYDQATARRLAHDDDVMQARRRAGRQRGLGIERDEDRRLSAGGCQMMVIEHPAR